MRKPHTLTARRCACGCAACGDSISAGLDLARARDTELGLYHVELADVPASLDDPATLTVSVTRRSHAVALSTHVAISGGRPRCRCAAPADLAITKRGAGRFETAAFSFPSPGWWILRVTVSGHAGCDAVTFNLAIE